MTINKAEIISATALFSTFLLAMPETGYAYTYAHPTSHHVTYTNIEDENGNQYDSIWEIPCDRHFSYDYVCADCDYAGHKEDYRNHQIIPSGFLWNGEMVQVDEIPCGEIYYDVYSCTNCDWYETEEREMYHLFEEEHYLIDGKRYTSYQEMPWNSIYYIGGTCEICGAQAYYGPYFYGNQEAWIEIGEVPEQQKSRAGESISLHVKAVSENLLYYQWQYSLDHGETWVNCVSTGADCDTFTFTMKEKFEGRLYRCIVSDDTGHFVTSGTTEIALEKVLQIKRQPADVVASTGKKVVLSVEAEGEIISYQWQYSKDNGKTWITCTSTGSNTDCFTFTMKDTFDKRLYRCIVKDAAGKTITSEATHVNKMADILLVDRPMLIQCANSSVVTLKSAKKGTSYQWQYSKDNGKTWTNCTSTGAKTDTFSFTMQSTFAGRWYRCIVK